MWTQEIPKVSDCSECELDKKITMMPTAWAKIKFMMKKYPKIEWLAYLVGDKDNLIVEDIIIPKQKISTAMVDDIVEPNTQTFGVIHSHHDMGHSFSGTDDKYINANNYLSICVSSSGYSGTIRIKTPCNKFKDIELTKDDFVMGEYLSEEEIKEMDKICDENIEEQKFVRYVGQQPSTYLTSNKNHKRRSYSTKSNKSKVFPVNNTSSKSKKDKWDTGLKPATSYSYVDTGNDEDIVIIEELDPIYSHIQEIKAAATSGVLTKDYIQGVLMDAVIDIAEYTLDPEITRSADELLQHINDNSGD